MRRKIDLSSRLLTNPLASRLGHDRGDAHHEDLAYGYILMGWLLNLKRLATWLPAPA